MRRRDFVATTLLPATLPAQRSPLPGVIFDTDMGNDIDDALALAMLHTFWSLGEAELLAVTVTKDNIWAPRYVSAVNTFYGRDKIPVGMVSNGKTPDEGKYNRQTIDGGRFPWREPQGEATEIIRKTLLRRADQSVTMIQVGFSTNLARLMGSAQDRALIEQKVRFLSVMGGDFAGGQPEYNIKIDIPAAQTLFEKWPTPIVVSGFEVGKTIKYPASSIAKDFGPKHPVAEGYRNYMKMPYDRETWDLTSVLYAVRPNPGYFTPSEPGSITVDANGNTEFRPAAGGLHRYLSVDNGQRQRILAEFIKLATYRR